MFNLRARKRTIGSLLAVGALTWATVVAPATAQPAPAAGPPAEVAAVPCPTTGVPGTDVTSWDQTFSQRGITMCEGFAGPSNVVKVQIVDLAAGARVRFGSSVPFTWNPDEPPTNDFSKLELGRFYMPNWANIANIGPPSAGGGFSVTNASFFTNTTDQWTKLSLPFKRTSSSCGSLFPGDCNTYGVAIHGTDPNSATPKKVLRTTSAGAQVQIASFPTIYNSSDAQCPGWEQCLVGFDSLVDPSGNPSHTDSRTFVGVNAVHGQNATRVYILTGSLMTVAEADLILQHSGASAIMQMDGGGSTGMQSYAGHWLQAGGLQGRAVPNVLSVRYG